MKPIKFLNHSTFIKLWCYRIKWMMPERFQNQSPVRKALLKLGNNISFINVGANDGLSGSPLAEFIFTKGWHGTMIEPATTPFNRLRSTYGHNKKIKLFNVAISDKDETKPFYQLPKNKKFLPGYDQIGSFNRQNLENQVERFGATQNDIYTTYEETCQLSSVTQEKPDVVLIDTEGHDGIVLKQINWFPKVIIFEHQYMPISEYKNIIEHLQYTDYNIETEQGDTVCTRKF